MSCPLALAAAYPPESSFPSALTCLTGGAFPSQGGPTLPWVKVFLLVDHMNIQISLLPCPPSQAAPSAGFLTQQPISAGQGPVRGRVFRFEIGCLAEGCHGEQPHLCSCEALYTRVPLLLSGLFSFWRFISSTAWIYKSPAQTVSFSYSGHKSLSAREGYFYYSPRRMRHF